MSSLTLSAVFCKDKVLLKPHPVRSKVSASLNQIIYQLVFFHKLHTYEGEAPNSVKGQETCIVQKFLQVPFHSLYVCMQQFILAWRNS